MRHRIAAWFSLLLGLFGCGKNGPTFRDVQKGKIPLAPSEVDAIEGFLEKIDVSARELRIGEYDMMHIAGGHVRKIYLFTSLEEISFVSALPELRSLSLPTAHLDDLRPLANLENLEALNLERGDLKSLEGIPCASLRELYLSVEDLASLEPLEECRNLDRLIVNDPPAEILSTLPPLPNLRVFGLEGVGPGEAGLGCLESYPNLEELYLEGPGIAHLPSMPGLPRLEKLSLQNAFGIESLTVPVLPSLKHLRGWRLGAERITLSVLPALEKLELTEGDLRHLELPPQPSLEEIDLSKNELETLHGIQGQPELLRIDLQENEDLASLDPLAASPKLSFVRANGTKVGILPPEFEERNVGIGMDDERREFNIQLQKLLKAYDESSDTWAESLPGGSGSLRGKSGGCRTKSSMHGPTEVYCDWEIERLDGTVFLAPVSGDIFESMDHGGPIHVTVNLSVEEGTARIYFRREIDLERMAELMSGYRKEGPLFSIRLGERPRSDTYRRGFRFAEARPGEPAELSGELHWLAGDAVFWLASIDGSAQGLHLRIEP
ncbi:MAG: hypothetical protein R3234_07490 [Thermoanaerobaculia bacterium]|nr:hypothetical protein [Thermoanaerobaculia bacterium]